jgi:toluene monooxygenase electron transfer component
VNVRYQIKMAGSESSFSCDEGDTLLRAGLRQGLGLAYECNAGACGSCKFDLVEGEVDDLFPDAAGLRPKERERGKRLACQCIPRSDCLIKMRTGEEYIPATRPERKTARLFNRVALTHDISLFAFETEGSAEFLPGQYALISLPSIGQVRAYSLSGLPNKEGIWQFGIRRVPGGLMSNALFDTRQEQDEATIDGPYGIAYLRADVDRPIVCIGGGSGLAPLLSILRATPPMKLSRVPCLLYGGRSPDDIPDVASMLLKEHVHVQFHPVVSMPDLAHGAQWSGDIGFVHEYIPKKLDLPLPSYEYYLAGPPPMIEATVRYLVMEGKVPSTQIHFDRFF